MFLPFKTLSPGLPIEEVKTQETDSGIITPPTPDEDRISKEKEKDYSAEGILKKIKGEE